MSPIHVMPKVQNLSSKTINNNDIVKLKSMFLIKVHEIRYVNVLGWDVS